MGAVGLTQQPAALPCTTTKNRPCLQLIPPPRRSRRQQERILRVQMSKAQLDALQEDPSCFEYDTFHDSIQADRKQKELDSFQAEKAGPRYLTAMMAARDHRKRVQDITFERREALAAKVRRPTLRAPPCCAGHRAALPHPAQP
jgi:Coiled-coil domain-containing protein 55 (DUF2040)